MNPRSHSNSPCQRRSLILRLKRRGAIEAIGNEIIANQAVQGKQKQQDPDTRGQMLSTEKLKRFKAATVFVMAGNPKRDRNAGTGSGFLIGERDGKGYVVTNAHVVGKFSSV